MLPALAVRYGVLLAFMKFVTTRSCLPFVVYRIALGLGVLALQQAGALSAP